MKPAILGGKPTFDQVVPITKPAVPQFEEIAEPLQLILNTGRLTNNSYYVREFEHQMADYLGIDCITYVNGTSALVHLLKGLNLQGKAILPSFTFVATVHAVALAGLEPVFADIDQATYALNPDRVVESIETNEHVSAVVPVGVFGTPCNITSMQAIASKYGIKVIFDSAHLLGSTYKGRKIGNFGAGEMFSLHAAKILAVGEGGMITTQSTELADWLRKARNFGLSTDLPDTGSAFVSGNSKMPEFSAILGLKGLENFEKNCRIRYELATSMIDKLQLPGISFQQTTKDADRVYQNFSIVVKPNLFGLNRDELATALAAENISDRKYFYPPVHRHRAYQEYTEKYDRQLPVTNWISENILCLPLYSEMSSEEAYRICDSIQRIHKYHQKVKNKIGR